VPPHPTLHDQLVAALDAGSDALDRLVALDAVDRRDEALTLLTVHGLHLAPVDDLGERARWQHHPAVATLKRRLEERYVERLGPPPAAFGSAADAIAALRAVAAADLVPEVYEWVATEARYEELVAFLALEGGPDGGFDDLVALCQTGLTGEPKLELARNYWDEMGRGDPAAVHTELHRRLVRATGMQAVPPADQPVEALERSLLGSLLATNRHLQPEMVGALGLVEMQAGPRCRKVVRGLRRLNAGEDALAFYVEHADADPRHGRNWIDHVVSPLAADPRWARGIVRGAAWRAQVNRRFFAEASRHFAGRGGRRAA
jgi:hypothetical protein